ncbi:uncharacterized protein [Periplaneta americana]|uniref:uncharacterized protein isoform X3 n=1 Tax=Periplaneta americana TaxID=6978 RepID=UPI0037E98E76
MLQRSVMDLIKIEPEVDPLDLQPHDNTLEREDNNALSEERNVSNLQVGGIKTECVDHSFTSDINVEDTPVPFSFAFVKCEVEDTPVDISSPELKSEVDEDFFDVDSDQQEQKVEVSSEENEVFSERKRLKTHEIISELEATDTRAYLEKLMLILHHLYMGKAMGILEMRSVIIQTA